MDSFSFLSSSCPMTGIAGIPYYYIALSFLIGGIPFGYIAGKLNGIDIRTKGSGNIGATNVFRTLGKGWGRAVFIADFLKGFIPALLATKLSCLQGNLPLDGFAALVALATILGHSYTPFLKFKGGKGVATSAGALLALMPIPFVLSGVVWIISAKISKYVSLSSIIAALILPIAAWFFHANQIWFVTFGVVAAVLVIVRHKSNIQRLIAGTESKIGESAK